MDWSDFLTVIAQLVITTMVLVFLGVGVAAAVVVVSKERD